MKLPRAAKNIKISAAFVNDPTMKKLNKEHRGKDKATDVLSFNMDEELPDGVYNLGEIVINLDQARKQAKEYEVELRDEVIRLVVHGVKSLLGEHK